MKVKSFKQKNLKTVNKKISTQYQVIVFLQRFQLHYMVFIFGIRCQHLLLISLWPSTDSWWMILTSLQLVQWSVFVLFLMNSSDSLCCLFPVFIKFLIQEHTGTHRKTDYISSVWTLKHRLNRSRSLTRSQWTARKKSRKRSDETPEVTFKLWQK